MEPQVPCDGGYSLGTSPVSTEHNVRTYRSNDNLTDLSDRHLAIAIIKQSYIETANVRFARTSGRRFSPSRKRRDRSAFCEAERISTHLLNAKAFLPHLLQLSRERSSVDDSYLSAASLHL